MSHANDRPRWSAGTGPGALTPDGCSVEFYAMMPDFGEPQIVHDAVPPGASIIELGCGTGRITDRLAELGHPVLGVDESPEMLAHVAGAETVCSPIEDLALGRRFDVVLLPSHLINNPDVAVRTALLATCRRHVSDGGCVIIQQHPPEWFATAGNAKDRVVAGVTLSLRDVTRPAPDLLSGTVEYVAGDRRWTQTFTAMQLSEPALAASLEQAGLRLDRYLTPNQSWLRVLPI
jgi:SAM-dependent methyltransferase